MESTHPITLALVFGGPSAEHDVSLVSAMNIYEVLKDTSLQILLIGVSRESQWKRIQPEDLLKTSFANPISLQDIGQPVDLVMENSNAFLVGTQPSSSENIKVDAVFPIIHGTYGEDGQLQQKLEKTQIPYVGSQAQACQQSFDKALTKAIIKDIQVPQVDYQVHETDKLSFLTAKQALGLPFFVKPARMGSSVGISKVSGESDFKDAIQTAFEHDSKIVLEKGVQARELECALLEKDGSLQVSPLGEVKPNHEFYSYEAKYLDPNGADMIIPASLDDTVSEQIKEMALKCFSALGCRDYARADFFLTEDNQIFFNEINTHPGFTKISQFPMLCKEMGHSYRDLILGMVQQAMDRSH